MPSPRTRRIRLPAPFLRRVSWLDGGGARPDCYPFTLPLFDNPDWEVEFDGPVTIITGENGCGKSTLIEALAALAGFDATGGSSGHRPFGEDGAPETTGAALAAHMRASWLPKVGTGWFFRAESFWTLAQYLDASGSQSADFLSHSHGEGFMRVFEERFSDQGIYLLDEPESALSPRRQLDLLAMLARVQASESSQVIMATHSPFLMALPGARLLQMGRWGLAPVALEDTAHFRLYRDFCGDPEAFIAETLDERDR